MIKAVLFDVGGVLEWSDNGKDNTKSVHGYVAKNLKVDLDTYFDVIGKVHDDAIEGKVSRKKMLRIMSNEFQVNSKKIVKLYYKGFKKVFESNKDLYKAAYSLKEEGYKIGILSDQWWLSKDNLVKPKMTKPFEVILVSCDVKIRKPDLKFYKLAVKKLKTKASEIIFIDNREWNLRPAQKLGMKTILFLDNEQCIKELRKLGVSI